MVWYDDAEIERLNGWNPNDVGELFEDKKTGKVFELKEVEIGCRRVWLESDDEMIYADVEDLPRNRFWYA